MSPLFLRPSLVVGTAAAAAVSLFGGLGTRPGSATAVGPRPTSAAASTAS